jgi:catechol 2,3-dioxygenase-like lactoylglutathione lyase family enzyme
MSRVQLALRVADLEASIEFYSTLFGVAPAKHRPGYANFAILEPPLKLVLLEGQSGQATVMDHLGVEVDSSEQIAATTERLAGEGLVTDVEDDDTTCCYARQDKM